MTVGSGYDHIQGQSCDSRGSVRTASGVRLNRSCRSRGWRRLIFAAAVAAMRLLGPESPSIAADPAYQKQAASDKRPNILWIVMDDMRYDAMGAYGRFDWVQTPNMDRLAAQGVRFNQAYCNSPSCGPSRHSMWTGNYPHNTGCYGFERSPNDHPASKPLFTDLLGEAGYKVAAYGKEETLRFVKGKDGAYSVYDPGRDHSKRRWAYKRDGQLEAEPSTFVDQVDEEALGVIRNPGQPPIIIAGTNPRPADKTFDAHLTQDAIEWARKQRGSSQPYLLFVGYRIPHTPVLPPKPFDTMYDPATMPIPDLSRLDSEQLPKQLQDVGKLSPFHELSEAQLRKVWAHYFAWASYGDHLVGQLVEEFKANSGDRPWMIVLVSDHGFLLGEHGMGQKFCYFDIVFRVPLVIASSDGRFSGGKVSDQLVELVDLAPTMLTAGGAKLPLHLDGRDLYATLSGAAPPRDHVIGDTYHATRRAGIRANLDGRRWKFAMRNRPDNFGMGEDVAWATRQPLAKLDPVLYDLEQDPEELNNLADDPAYADVAEKLRRMLEGRILTDRVEVDWRAYTGGGATYGKAWTDAMQREHLQKKDQPQQKQQQKRDEVSPGGEEKDAAGSAPQTRQRAGTPALAAGAR